MDLSLRELSSSVWKNLIRNLSVLDVEENLGGVKDYRDLAELLLGISYSEITTAKVKHRNTTEWILETWCKKTNPRIRDLMDAMHKLKRQDVISGIEPLVSALVEKQQAEMMSQQHNANTYGRDYLGEPARKTVGETLEAKAPFHRTYEAFLPTGKKDITAPETDTTATPHCQCDRWPKETFPWTKAENSTGQAIIPDDADFGRALEISPTDYRVTPDVNSVISLPERNPPEEGQVNGDSPSPVDCSNDTVLVIPDSSSPAETAMDFIRHLHSRYRLTLNGRLSDTG